MPSAALRFYLISGSRPPRLLLWQCMPLGRVYQIDLVLKGNSMSYFMSAEEFAGIEHKHKKIC